MAQELRLKAIQDYPLGNHLDAFRTSFDSVHKNPSALDNLSNEELQSLAIDLLVTLLAHKVTRSLPSYSTSNSLFVDLSRLLATIGSGNLDSVRFKPLLNAVLTPEPNNEIWDQVYSIVAEFTTPPHSLASSFQQTPWSRNTGSFPNSSEFRNVMDNALRNELCNVMYADIPLFHEKLFQGVDKLEAVSEAFFKECTEGTGPPFDKDKGWTGWPEDANEPAVLSWFAGFAEKLSVFAKNYKSDPTCQRQLLGQPTTPIQGSIAVRKLDIGIMDHPETGGNPRWHWSQILVPGELKSNPKADTPAQAWLDIGRYAREVFAAQDTRRFVLAFTLCGSRMRVWKFDRIGGIASEQIDINQNGLRFVETILGFLWINREDLGFDPTIKQKKDQRFIEIEKDGETEYLIIDELMMRQRCVVGRATTCWKAHRQGHPGIPLVIKDSWQHMGRKEEGVMLSEAKTKNVTNVARHYHHETVRVCDTDDDIFRNVRKGIDITNATKPPPHLFSHSKESTDVASQDGRNNSGKRPSSQPDSRLRPSKRSRSTLPAEELQNRIHRRVIVSNYGKAIYTASSRPVLLSALEGCITGHKSLLEAGLLHRDISINNLIINEDGKNHSPTSFLIDLDLAIEEPRKDVSGAAGRTGTLAFMAIGALLGEKHSFMHDLESFFWVLFWICIHYKGPGGGGRVTKFDDWNYATMQSLVGEKTGLIANGEEYFLDRIKEAFTPYYHPLIPCINELRKEVFPNDKRWKKENRELYTSMEKILREAQENPAVVGGNIGLDST